MLAMAPPRRRAGAAYSGAHQGSGLPQGIAVNDPAALDDSEFRSRLDPAGMGRVVHALPDQCREAWTEAQRFSPPGERGAIRRFVILAMGGSAIAGDLFRALLGAERGVPVANHRDYSAPVGLDARTLLVACSVSGDTEETLSAFQGGMDGPGPKLAITMGGRLLALTRERGFAAFTFAFTGKPRSALGWCLMPLVRVAQAQGMWPDADRDVAEAVAAMAGLRDRIGADVPRDRNPAKQLAARLAGRMPVVFGAEILGEVARRWKIQFNETAEVWAAHETVPEASHNALVGYALPRGVASATTALLLRAPGEHPRLALHFEHHRRTLADAGVECLEVPLPGGGPLARAMTGVLMGDFVAHYLALLNGVDPSAIRPIDALKRRLRDASQGA